MKKIIPILALTLISLPSLGEASTLNAASAMNIQKVNLENQNKKVLDYDKGDKSIQGFVKDG